MNHDSELDNPLFQRLWDAEARANRMETALQVAITVATVCAVLAALFYFGQPVCVPIPRGE